MNLIVGIGLVLLVAGLGWYVYVQLTVPTLYGDWAGTIYLYDKVESADGTQTNTYEIEFKLTFTQAGDDTASTGGSVLGTMVLNGEPWSSQPDTLEFVGLLSRSEETPTLTLSAQGKQPNEEGLTPSIGLKGQWEGNRIQGVLGVNDVHGFAFLEGEWFVEKK